MKLLKFKLDKLIRDKMSAQMRAEDIIVHDRILNDTEYLHALKTKLKEEAQEVVDATNKQEYINECADVLEVLYALAQALNISLDQIEHARLEKKEQKGAFENKIFVSYVEHTENNPATLYARAQPNKYPEIV